MKLKRKEQLLLCEEIREDILHKIAFKLMDDIHTNHS